ncbi:hypothetical protein E2C01_049147 [Portunus trituberculatus]|uniref:Uncharacterized protein n=1 Tax=Portunus trituberculatus TaxID=210409 RepID=A0A5B7GCX0_PORTR|nr:hypothetical protein [Portunus trituberculatus]
MEPGTRGVSLHRAKWRRGSEVERLCGASALWEPSEFVLPEEMLDSVGDLLRVGDGESRRMPSWAGGSAGRGWRATSPRGPAVREPPPHALMILPRFYDYNQVVESGGLAVLAGDPRHLSMVLRALSST